MKQVQAIGKKASHGSYRAKRKPKSKKNFPPYKSVT